MFVLRSPYFWRSMERGDRAQAAFGDKVVVTEPARSNRSRFEFT
jgi:hypothetical protein